MVTAHHRLRDLETTHIHSQGSGGWEVQDQVTNRFEVWWEHATWFTNGHLAVSSSGERGRGSLWRSFLRILIPFKRALPLWHNNLRKALPPHSTSGVRFWHVNFGVHKYSVCMCVSRIRLLWPHGLKPSRLLCPWNFPGKDTGVGCHALLQGIFLTQGLNPCLLCLLHWQVGSLPLTPGKPT